MRSRINLLYILLITLTLTNCNSDENINNSSEDNVLYLKSYKSNNAPSPGYYDSYYEYNNGYLISANGFTSFLGNYQYDATGKLLNKNSNGINYSYVYNSDGKLVKQIEIGTNNNIILTYNLNKVNITNTYEIAGGTPYSELSELELDNSGRIIKYRNLTPTTSYEFMSQEYSYDNKGNITQVRFKENNYNDPDYTVNYVYDDNKNPFFYSYKKLYKSIYYLNCRKGIQNYKHLGFTPNNMIQYGISESYVHTYNNLGYPINWAKTTNNGVTEYNLEYY